MSVEASLAATPAAARWSVRPRPTTRASAVSRSWTPLRPPWSVPARAPSHCADIVTFAARDSVNLFYQVPSGRRDGNGNVPTEIDALSFLPGPNSTASDLVDGFGNKTLTAEEMVVLSGSQTIDRAVPRRQLPVPEPGAAAQRQHQPGIPGAAGWRCAPPTPASSRRAYQALLDNNYYKLLKLDLGLHFSDDQLIRNATLAPSVAAFAANETLWKEKFVAAMIKMGNIEVIKTGAQGEVRLNCSIVNAPSSSSSIIEMILPGSTDVSTS
ncbi:hypothetical protein EJB05_30708, partial [Eragrostis curvula]